MKQLQQNVFSSSAPPAQESVLVIEKLNFAKKEVLERTIMEATIVAVIEGRVRLCLENSFEITLVDEQLLFLPPGTRYKTYVKEDSLLLFFCLEEHILRYGLPLGLMSSEEFFEEKDPIPIRMNKVLRAYMDNLVLYLDDGFENINFCEVKLRELLMLFDGYYTRQEMARFFYPLSGTDAHFTSFVFRNYQSVKTVIEFAEKANLSLSSFYKEFQKVFKTSPYRWMKEKRSRSIFYEIKYNEKPLKVICEEYGFSSPSQMNDYCKKVFGMTPGKIRETNLKNA